MHMKNYLFVYGSLMNDEVTQALLQCPLMREPAMLKGYQRVGVRGASYPGIFAKANEQVAGQVISGLTADQWHRLDEFEGEYYSRTLVTVELTSGEGCEAWAYVFKDDYFSLLSDEPWCNEVFKSRDMTTFVKTYAGYLTSN